MIPFRDSWFAPTDPTAEDSDSTSSGDADWYENIHKPQQHVEEQRDEPSFAGEEWMS